MDFVTKTILGKKYWIPKDLKLDLPTKSSLPEETQHFLLFIPWEERYIQLVPDEFRNFFRHLLPYMHVRTTDVHTAICLGMLVEFIAGSGFPSLNRRVIALALTLHDCGWSLLTEEEIASSLGVQGLQLTPSALGPKEKHARVGTDLARRILQTFSFIQPLSKEEEELILACVLYHDKPEVVSENGQMKQEVQLLVDLDHIWSFTHENFWQDTIRKGVLPETYLRNLQKDLSSYFVTDFGKKKASLLLQEREKEVEELKRLSF